MKKVINFLKAVGFSLIVGFALLLPMGWQFLVYGSYHNGYTIYRYRHSTEVSYSPTALHIITIVGKNDCTPSYKIMQSLNPKGGGSYEEVALSPQDYQEWNKAMN